MELKQVEKIAKALSDINRLKILQHMQRHQGKMECNETCSLLNLAQPSISHHIKKLVESELINQHKEGRYYNYSLNDKVWEAYLNTLKKL
ncbi:helix-turn-helix transcriptional regulator [Flavobacterium jejuense]|uniref:Helix-turn-helix transcriptional regulator n=1 Tax=Flavobacterium jejuense TaxID=1544455 RepID=A0ABX0IK93_9FLAO|nr:metalloregulator ArsR/SmtB family transcription factor [Flavobacterium jejuense]NHN24247.1 helix-turn-helix transcriptional regulator [Flavobacterium jejuense]